MRLAPRKVPFRLSLGDRGEMVAWNFLTQRGYKILEKNYRCRLGEIDVVAEKKSKIVFVEIKTRTTHAFGSPEESVHRAKQRKLLQLAEWYLREKGKSDSLVSFDVVGITWQGSQEPEIRLIENAFDANEKF